MKKRATKRVRRYEADEVTVTIAGTIVAGPGLAKTQPTATPVPVFMSTDSATRKLMPVASGCLNYFPDALLCVSFISRVGNDKHNPSQPLHWAKEKSTDEADCEVRHMLDFLRGEAADPGLEPLGELGHLASKAWRALAHLQRACDDARKASGR
jgi:hypothetical protein